VATAKDSFVDANALSQIATTGGISANGLQCHLLL
jgi:hypothetical protein